MTDAATDPAALNERFAHAGLVRFEPGEGGLTRAVLSRPRGDVAHVYLHGAHVSHYQPADAEPVLFVSAASRFEPGQPIRGGVPVCFPWFGPHPEDADQPPHGFARILPWQVQDAGPSEAGASRMVLRLEDDAPTHRFWPHRFAATLTILLEDELTIALAVCNPDHAEGDLRFEEALHTYFAVADVRQVSITGLAGANYIDKVDAMQRKRQGDEPIRIRGETDRIYLDTETTCEIEDPAADRRLLVAKRGSRSTVLWNPWIEKAAAMADFGDEQWSRMLCIETANAADNAITLAPGQRHEISATLTARSM